MSPLARRVRAAIRRGSLIDRHDRVLLALSGGADSVAMAWLLRELTAAGDVQIAGVVHVHHGLRGDEADADAAFCKALALRLGWPIDVVRVDVRAEARRRRVSIETAARALRYAAFDAAAARLGATLVATAHTADDQAETVLMRLLRGAGTRGLSGIRRRRGHIVRPLLDVRRRELRAYLEARGEAFREDASNADVSIVRNRIRAELMPVVERLAPKGVAALARLAGLAADDEAYFEDCANLVAPTASKELEVDTLRHLPLPVARRVVRRLAAAAAPAATLSARHVEAVLSLVRASRATGSVDVPGSRVRRRGGRLSFVAAPARRPQASGFAHALAVPGEVRVPETGDVIRAELAARAGGITATATRAVLQADTLTLPLVVRSRRPGDRLRPLGAPGRRKVQDLLVDRKIPREIRDSVPIVEDAIGRIVWVAGVAIEDACRVTAPQAGVVILDLDAVARA